MITLENINIEFNSIVYINSQKIAIPNGRITVLTGPSGCGKTSILYYIGLLNKSNIIKYNVDGKKLSEEKFDEFRRLHIGYVFQDNNLIENTTILENFNIISRLCNTKISLQSTKELLQQIHLDKELDTLISELSGGEKQRLAIALALSKNPDLIILDEPTSYLDQENSILIMDIIKAIALQGKTIIIASHDSKLKELGDLIYTIENKKIVLSSGEVKEDYKPIKWKYRKPNKFNRYYIYLYMKKNLKFYYLLFLFSSIVICLCSTSLNFSSGFSESQINDYKENVSNDFLITEVNDNKIAKEISLWKEITAVYPYQTWVSQNHIIIPLYTEGLTNNFVNRYISENKVGCYISEQYFASLAGENNDSIIIDINGESINTPIIGVYNVSVKNKYVEQNLDEIYITSEVVKEVGIDSNTWIVFTNDYRDIDEIITRLKRIDSTIEIKNNNNYLDINNQIKKIGEIGNFYSVILYLITIILMIITYSKLFYQRKYEVCLLKANGLSNKSFYYLFISEILVHLSIVFINICIFTCILEIILTNWLNIKISILNIRFFTNIILFTSVQFLLPSLIIIKKIINYDPAKILRS